MSTTSSRLAIVAAIRIQPSRLNLVKNCRGFIRPALRVTKPAGSARRWTVHQGEHAWDPYCTEH